MRKVLLQRSVYVQKTSQDNTPPGSRDSENKKSTKNLQEENILNITSEALAVVPATSTSCTGVIKFAPKRSSTSFVSNSLPARGPVESSKSCIDIHSRPENYESLQRESLKYGNPPLLKKKLTVLQNTKYTEENKNEPTHFTDSSIPDSENNVTYSSSDKSIISMHTTEAVSNAVLTIVTSFNRSHLETVSIRPVRNPNEFSETSKFPLSLQNEQNTNTRNIMDSTTTTKTENTEVKNNVVSTIVSDHTGSRSNVVSKKLVRYHYEYAEPSTSAAWYNEPSARYSEDSTITTSNELASRIVSKFLAQNMGVPKPKYEQIYHMKEIPHNCATTITGDPTVDHMLNGVSTDNDVQFKDTNESTDKINSINVLHKEAADMEASSSETNKKQHTRSAVPKSSDLQPLELQLKLKLDETRKLLSVLKKRKIIDKIFTKIASRRKRDSSSDSEEEEDI